MNTLAVKNDTNVVLKFIAMLALVLVGVFGSTALAGETAHAVSTNNVVDLGKNSATVNAMVGEINKKTGISVLKYSSSTGILEFNNSKYSEYSGTDKQKYMSDSLGYIKKGKLNDKVKNKFFNFVADQDTTNSAAIRNLKVDAQTDLATASSILKPFTGWVSVVLGVISLVVVMLLGIGTVLDISYIALPFFRAFFTDSEKRPMFLSNEAFASTEESENSVGSGQYKSAIGLYLRRRFIVLICVGLCIMYLITGQIFDIIGFFVDMFSGAF